MIERHKLCYLASPYSEFAAGLDAAFCAAARLAGHLTAAGVRLYSPIVHSHPLARLAGLDPRDAGFWLDLNAVMMARCDLLIVAELAGWRDSVGVAVEIAHFQEAGKPIFYCEPSTLLMSKADRAGGRRFDLGSINRERAASGLPPVADYAHGKARGKQGGSSA